MARPRNEAGTEDDEIARNAEQRARTASV